MAWNVSTEIADATALMDATIRYLAAMRSEEAVGRRGGDGRSEGVDSKLSEAAASPSP
jgi:hypothetical protein